MTSVTLFSINHKKNRTYPPIEGGIVKEFVIGRDDTGMLPMGYCDMGAPYTIWQRKEVPAIIGFHGYRKHMVFQIGWEVPSCYTHKGHFPVSWHEVGSQHFIPYQMWLTHWDARPITHGWLQHYDVLTVEPFDCSYNGGMAKDYAVSRSANDWYVLEDLLRDRGFSDDDFKTSYIRPMHFVMRDHTFCRFMRFWDTIRRDLEQRVYSDDARDDVAKDRALAFLSERIWSLWLDRAQLRVKTFPLMISWEAQ